VLLSHRRHSGRQPWRLLDTAPSGSHGDEAGLSVRRRAELVAPSLSRGLALLVLARSPVLACLRAQRQRSARWRRTAMGAALDSFIDEDGYRALDALNELRESYGFHHREGHMHRSAIGPR
jgi:hypothetical protein